MNPTRLKIKLVQPSEADFQKKEGGGGPQQPFVPVTPELRASLATQAATVAQHVRGRPSPAAIPSVARVVLRPEAVAKSHRPTGLLNRNTCPIIGGSRLGELHVTADPVGLSRLANLIRTLTGDRNEYQVSTLQEIQPYTAVNVLSGNRVDQLTAKKLRVELFRHGTGKADDNIDREFLAMCDRASGASCWEVPYSRGTKFYSVSNFTPELVRAIADFPGTKRVDRMPTYRLGRVATSLRAVDKANPDDFPRPDPNVDYPVIGVIDGGVRESDPILGPWVVGRLPVIHEALRLYDHGTFVAGLIVFGHLLNHRDERFPNAPCRIIDVPVFDENGAVDEDDLVFALDQAIPAFPQARVWSLSLQTDEPCRDEEVSPLGQKLDDMQETYGVQFTVAVGNLPDDLIRSWPPAEDLGGLDRVCPPADSVHALTVGSVTHLDTAVAGANEPSPFTRRGPGPVYAMKPEVVFPGGNCHPDGTSHQVGVLSLSPHGEIVEGIGTSYATPQGAAVVGHIGHQLAHHDLPSGSGKALAVHSALLDSESGMDPMYVGAGTTSDVTRAISCAQHAPTLAFRIPLEAGRVFVKDPFPMPLCLFDDRGGLQAELLATMHYTPPTDGRYGVEYCRTNVSITLGTVSDRGDEGEKFSGRLDPYPPRPEMGAEAQLIRNGLKWVPLKLHRRRFGPRFKHRDWRLKVELLQRGAALAEGEVQDVLLLITIRSLVTDRLVYDELVREMIRLGWAISDLTLRGEYRIQP